MSLDATAAALAETGSLFLNHGVARDETISVTFRAALPGLSELPVGGLEGPRVEPTATGFSLSEPALASRLRAGDVGSASGDASCPATLTVDAADPLTGEVTTTPPLSAGCTQVTLAAGPIEPWVVRGALTGYLGRTADGEVFTSGPGVPFAHPDDFVEGAPQLAFRFRVPTGHVPTAGQVLRFDTIDGFATQRSRIGSLSTNQISNPPGPVTLLPASDDYPLGSVWVAYPSQNLVAVFAPVSIVPNQSIGSRVGSTDVIVFR